MTRYPITVCDLDLPSTSITLTAWLVSVGDMVVEGDRVAEIVAGDVTVDLESPANGVLIEKLASVDEPLAVGQVIGIVAARE